MAWQIPFIFGIAIGIVIGMMGVILFSPSLWKAEVKCKMTIKGILEKWLKDNGYDGLCDNRCGCVMDDLMPCKVPCDCGEGCEWHVMPSRKKRVGEEMHG